MKNNRFMTWAVMLSVMALSGRGYGIIIESGAVDQDYINYGSQFGSTVWTAVDGEFAGSAVVIDDGHWVLTSAHVPDYADYTLASTMSIGTGSHITTDPGSVYTASAVFIHPGYVGGEDITDIDIALLYFEDAITDVTPAQRYANTLEVNDLVSIVGYGYTGTGLLGRDGPLGQKRGAQAYIAQFGLDEGGDGIYEVSEDYAVSFFDDPSETDLDYGGIIDDYDSGGGWYVDVEGEQQVAGISIYSLDTTYGSDMGAIRLSETNSWIDSTIVSIIPEPASIGLILIFGGMMLGIRHTRLFK